MTLGTFMMSALVLAGCGGGAGSLAPRLANQVTTPASAARHVKSLSEGLAAGEVRPLCGAVQPRRARCSSFMLTARGMGAAALAAPVSPANGHAPPPPPGYGPADLQSAYGLTAAAKNSGAGAVIAIVDAFDDPQAEHDLAVYRARYGLPPCTRANGCFRKVNQDGKPGPLPPGPPPDALGWQVEISLDLDMVSANCPRCKILLVESNDDYANNLGAAVNTAADMDAVAISNSYVLPESATDTGPISKDGLLAYYVHPHVAVVAGSGDFGYMDSWPYFAALIPAAFPSVIAVGGTALVPDTGTARGWSEWAWNGTGSGCSAYEPMPPWQTADPACAGSHTDASGRASTFPSRMYGDVAYVGSAYTGVAVYDSNGQFGTDGWGVLGGTSVGAPAIAAIYGLAGYGRDGDGDRENYPFPARKLYAAKRSLFDITAGANAACADVHLCTAGRGWDGPTGNGTPNGIGAF